MRRQIVNRRILFADDEEMLTILGKTALEQLGYKVTTVADGVTALAMFTDEPNRFDIVITDQTMPQMTGENLARQILEIRPDMPIILCTGYCSTIDESKARTLGIKELMLKPVQMGHLATMVRELLDSAKSKNLPVPTNN
ncbi:MAG: response regulator [Deltaproteobacteria bacterium]|nr:response regulator [Deltaproteobacteria bacterium]